VKSRWRSILLSLAVAFFFGLAYLNRAFLFTYLIEPIARILWLIYKTFLSVDQETYWLLLILAAMILLLRIIPGNRDDPLLRAYPNSMRISDRVAHWENLLKSARKSSHYSLTLQHELESLHRSIGELSGGNEEIGMHLLPVKTGFLQRIRGARVAQLLSRIIPQRKITEATELEKQIDILLKSMETQLEIHNDRISNHPAND
jgi:hypothetical protein